MSEEVAPSLRIFIGVISSLAAIVSLVVGITFSIQLSSGYSAAIALLVCIATSAFFALMAYRLITGKGRQNGALLPSWAILMGGAAFSVFFLLKLIYGQNLSTFAVISSAIGVPIFIWAAYRTTKLYVEHKSET